MRPQPLHTLYGGAHLFKATSVRRIGEIALSALDLFAPSAGALASLLEIDSEIAELVYGRVRAKLQHEPVEDYRIDFEDGFGPRTEEEEDREAARAAGEVARAMAERSLPRRIGIRVRPMAGATEARALRTLDRFTTELLARAGCFPDGFVVTLPKVEHADQVVRLVDRLDAIDPDIAVEIMIESARGLMDASGRCPLMELAGAARGRCTGVHFGAYDYLASLGITAQHQRLDHPACDFARHTMKVALAGSGIALSDGATTLLPIPLRPEATDAVHRAWRLAHANIRRALEHGIDQGWDLHPAQLPIRYATSFAFFLEGLELAVTRLRNFVGAASRATTVGGAFDDAATGQGLLNSFLRAWRAGAITEAEIRRTGLTLEELEARSFEGIAKFARGARSEPKASEVGSAGSAGPGPDESRRPV
jgi:citrate lyase beta subunit